MLFVIIFIFLMAIAIPFLYKWHRKTASVILIFFACAVTAFFIRFIEPVSNGVPITESYEWLPALSINLSFYLDGLSLFFSLLISSFGLIILIYSIRYMLSYSKVERFYIYLLFFMGSMLGLVLSANLITLIIFWELTSISSFLLIGFKNKDEASQSAARQALLVTAGGGLALLAAFILMQIAGGSFHIPELINNRSEVIESPLINMIIILTLIGAFSKSAQFPFHFWLPNAMEAPTPVSTYLHAATMVKAGIYLVLRMHPLFMGIEIWQLILVLTGGFTMIFGAFRAFQADDLKQILAFTTISALGIFFMMTGTGTETAIHATIIYIMAHAFYKGTLFLVTGNIEHETGTRMVSELAGLGRKLPWTAFAAVFACLSMAGILPFIGYTGKEILYEALYHSTGTGYLSLLILLVITGAFYTAIAIEISYAVFIKNAPVNKWNFKGREIFFMALPPVLLGLGGFFAGLIPGLFSRTLVNSAASAVHKGAGKINLELWHGFNFIFILSLLTITGGVILYFFRKGVRNIWKKASYPQKLKANNFYFHTINGIEELARYQTLILQNGYLRNYISICILLATTMIILLFFDAGFWQQMVSNINFTPDHIYEIATLILISTALFIFFRTASKLTAVATIGIAGFGVALAYTIFSAPDVAITQILAESLSLILLILILHRLPEYTIKTYRLNISYLFISGLFGITMIMVSLLMISVPEKPGLKEFFLKQSIPLGKGANAVNVILVDFRALDTLGEITVLIVTMTGIIALLHFKEKQQES